MINEHDIKDLIDRVYAQMPKKVDNGEIEVSLEDFTETLCKILAEACDRAWYYDAANLIRKMTGIPVSLMGPCSAHAKDDYEEDL